MSWTIATLGRFDPVEEIEEKLKDFQYFRDKDGFKLSSAIQLSPASKVKLSDEVEILSGIVIDEYIVKNTYHIEKAESGRWEVVEAEPFKDTRWAGFWLSTRSIILTERKDSRGFVFRVISQALTDSDDHIQCVEMDIERIANDHPGHWLGSIKDRAGNMQNATMYGDSLENDNVIGTTYVRSHKSQVGITTDFFEAPVKVRITKDGTITVMRNLNNAMEVYIQYIRRNLLPYASPASCR